MSKNFHWTTEDDADWADTAVPPPPPRPKPRRWWGMWLLALILGAGGLLYWRAKVQVTAVTANVEADILSSQALLDQAANQNDIELFTTILSGRDASWIAAQQALFQQELLWDRSSFGLDALPSASAVVSLTVAADLQSAEVLVERRYVVSQTDTNQPDGRGASFNLSPSTAQNEAVTLLLPLIFRKGESRWLLSPPSEAYWGGWQQAEGHYITLIFPERDADIALRLLPEMDAQVKKLCNFEPAADCPGGWQLLVRLETDPASLTAVADPQTLLQPAPIFELPTPSLLGLPVDEAGYQALAQAYAGQVVNRAIVDVVAMGGWARPLDNRG